MPNAYSLHIGLNNVDPTHYLGWDGKLYCCENDALFYHTLAEKAGFTDRKLLLSSGSNGAEMPTSANLDKWLEQYSKTLQAGDFLFITYSGHGGQIQDFNFDEPDMLDETWCMYDRQYIDDELWVHFSRFAKGVRILMISDSCHSGSISKVIASAKDKEIEGHISDIYKKMKLTTRNAPMDVTFPTYLAHRDAYAGAVKAPIINKDEVNACVLLMAACQDQETAAEWDGFGLYTSTIRKVLLNNDDINSYEDWHTKIKTQMPSIQHPNLFSYGTGIDAFVKEKIFQVNGKNHFSMFDPGKAAAPAPTTGENLIVDLGKHEPVAKDGYKAATLPTRDGSAPAIFLKETPPAAGNAWDEAYREYFALKSEGKPDAFVEPNAQSRYMKETPAAKAGPDENNYMPTWPKPDGNLGANEFIWHLDDKHSQLRTAAMRVMKKIDDLTPEEKKNYKTTIRIAHIDTGYVPSHPATPQFIQANDGISFVHGEDGNKGIDIFQNRIKILEQDGHGSATMAILAGNTIKKEDSYTGYEGYFGGIPFAEVVPVRICDTVYNAFNANDVARGIEYALQMGCEVITMSMAGYPTRRVAQAINKAYEAGVLVVTAAGNNWVKGISNIAPKAVLYPARFDRVIAACGVCYNELPYDFAANEAEMKLRSEGGDTMQGNWGPEQAMKTALAAYTPNLAWANNNPAHKYRFSKTGGGTSSSTPQIAAAAALWILYNRKELAAKGYAGTWKQVEAARQALFSSAGTDYPGYKKYYGNGSLRANGALDISAKVLDAPLEMAKEASVSLLGIGMFIKQWFRDMPARAADGAPSSADASLQEMAETEIMQVLYKDPALYDYLDKLDLDGGDQSYLQNASARQRFIDTIKASKYASDTLKTLLK